MKRLVFAIAAFCQLPLMGCAQLVDYGQNAPGLHWQSLTTPHIELIFPRDYSLHARRIAAVLEKAALLENRSLKVSTRRIPVLLQNQGVESNAFVLLAPRRSEFYTLSPADQEPGDWLESLGLHEMRHVVQEDKVFGGHNVPLAETLQLAVFGLVFPPWFFEGDAVVMETALTASGRGRLARFNREYRVNLLSGKNYSYSKYYLGSQRDNVPDYYRLGYFMVSRLRRDYSDSIYEKIFTRSLRLTPWPLSTSLKKYTGFTTPRFFKETTKELRAKWQESYRRQAHVTYAPVNVRTDSIYANYLFPHLAGKDSIVYLKTSLDHTPGFYLNRAGRDKDYLLIRIGVQFVPHFDFAAGLLVWDEVRDDPRYAYRTYSVLRTLNIHTSKQRTITHKSRLFAPALSHDGRRIVAVHSDLENRVSIYILNSSTGEVLEKIAAKTGHVYQFPRFDPADNHIICIDNSNLGKSLVEIDIKTGLARALSKPVFNDISRPAYLNQNKIAFTFSGRDKEDIYLLDRKNGHIFALTNSRFGASAALPAGDSVLFNNFGVRGDDIAKIGLNSLTSPDGSLAETTFYSRPFSETDTLETHGSAFLEQRVYSKLPTRDLQDSALLISPKDSLPGSSIQRPYREVSNLFHVHSILPAVKQVDLGSLSYLAGLKLESTNLLNTMEGYVAAYYNNNNRTTQYEAGLIYKKWYPYISLYLTDKKRFNIAAGKKNGKTIYLPFNYRELQYNLSLEVPLNFTIGDQVYQTGVQVLTSLTHNSPPSIPLRNFRTEIKFPLHYSFYFLKSRLAATRDLYPAFSQDLSFSFEHLPFERTLKGRTLYLNSNFSFPGFAPHHSFQLSFNVQEKSGAYAGERDITEISGYEVLPPNRLRNTLLTAYYFPVAYTDWELGPVAYIRRLQAGVFFNSENILGRNDGLYGRYNTFGPDLRLNCNLLRYYLPVFQLGARLVLFQKGIASPRVEFLVNYTL